jgi:hypothetical protein
VPTIAQQLQTKRRIPLADMRVGSVTGAAQVLANPDSVGNRVVWNYLELQSER